MTLRILFSDSDNPWFNIAVEDCIFRQLPAEQKILFLWRNADTVVIGRSQNPWKECNTARMEQDGIKLARRQSGGGSVFHDLGNTNFTIMAGKPEYNKEVSTSIIIRAMQRLGLTIHASGRNDLVIQTIDGERKISGSAYRELIDRGFHHGTLLLNANLSRLADYLNPDPKKLQAKGITSVRSRVANLVEIQPQIDHAQVCEAITAEFCHHYNETATVEYIQPDCFADLPGLQEQFEQQRSWQWNFGEAPQFQHQLDERFSWGGVEVFFDVEKGVISRARIYTDGLDPAPLEALAEALIQTPYRPKAIEQKIAELAIQYPGVELTETGRWLTAAIC